ncbi:MAG: hypothetical protein JNL61_04670 [Rhizobiaceae bacterium]|nr:hypothetical protein [Rhizobiaceae bacterium]
MRIAAFAALIVLGASIVPALASSSPWTEAQGANLRLVTTGVPDADGKLRGALEIQLRPGWKTYWRDPGSSGVPPAVDVSGSLNIAAAEVSFPAPKRFPDEFGGWAGYDGPVAFPVVLTVADPSKAAVVEAAVFLGVCESICVPVQATLDVDTGGDPQNTDDASVVAQAFANLPAEADKVFGAVAATIAGDKLTVEAVVPGMPEQAELFVASADGYSLGAPERAIVDGRLRFVVPVFDQPKAAPAGVVLPYTLTTPSGAVSGSLPLD